MSDTNEEADFERDEYDITTPLSLRDYPSTVLVLIGVLGSGLAWLLYKRLNRTNAKQSAASGDKGTVETTGSSYDAPGMEGRDGR